MNTILALGLNKHCTLEIIEFTARHAKRFVVGYVMERKYLIAIDLEEELWIFGLAREDLVVNAHATIVLMNLSQFDDFILIVILL